MNAITRLSWYWMRATCDVRSGEYSIRRTAAGMSSGHEGKEEFIIKEDEKSHALATLMVSARPSRDQVR